MSTSATSTTTSPTTTTRTTGATLVGSVIFDVPKDVALKIAYAPVLKNLAVWS